MLQFEILDDCHLRLLEEADANELYALVDANRGYLAPWMPWASGQTHEGTLEFIRMTRQQLAKNDGIQTVIVCGGSHRRRGLPCRALAAPLDEHRVLAR
jgi:ribosomal-protein-serine acetyltransferase